MDSMLDKMAEIAQNYYTSDMTAAEKFEIVFIRGFPKEKQSLAKRLRAVHVSDPERFSFIDYRNITEDYVSAMEKMLNQPPQKQSVSKANDIPNTLSLIWPIIPNGLSVKIVHKAHIDELLTVSPQFAFIKGRKLAESDAIRWNMDDKTAYCIQIMFIGKTGYGKSTTLNKICGHKYFETNDVESCTKELFSCEYKISDSKEHYFSLCDLPGIGESNKADKPYINWYDDMLKKSACVVYVLRVDQRDFSVDEELINNIVKNSKKISAKLVIGLNFADKIEPVSRNSPFSPSKEQKMNLDRKADAVSNLFGIETARIVYYSATDGYNILRLKQSISNTVKESVGYHE
jgi:small GTP-binding protein